MPDDRSTDYEALRTRFPWVGLVDEEWGDVAARYREIMADALVTGHAADAVEPVRRNT